MTLEEWITTINNAVERYSSPLSPAEAKGLLLPAKSDRATYDTICERVMEPVMREIFARGRDGKTFGDPRRLEKDILYGSVEAAFPHASPTFLNVTRAFLTFWKEYKDIAHIEPRVILQSLLLGFIIEHKKRFFPAATVDKPVPHIFAREQREVLEVWGNGIDIEDFFRSNPLLI